MNNPSPSVEHILAERADRLAHRQSMRVESTPRREVLLLKIGGQLAGLDVAYVREILRVENVVPVPDAAEHLLGLLNIHNDFICLLDGASLLNLESSSDAPDWAILLRHDSLRLALTCDEALRLASLPATAFDEQGIFRHGESLGTLLNIPTLLASFEAPVSNSYSS